jgi:hypothetical protein
MLEFLDTDVFNVSAENCVSFLDSLIESWDIDLATFGMEVVLNRRLIPGYAKKIEFVETGPIQPQEEPGLKEFLRKQSLGIPASHTRRLLPCDRRRSAPGRQIHWAAPQTRERGKRPKDLVWLPVIFERRCSGPGKLRPAGQGARLGGSNEYSSAFERTPASRFSGVHAFRRAQQQCSEAS